jgi:hypothetical protein
MTHLGLMLWPTVAIGYLALACVLARLIRYW